MQGGPLVLLSGAWSMRGISSGSGARWACAGLPPGLQVLGRRHHVSINLAGRSADRAFATRLRQLASACQRRAEPGGSGSVAARGVQKILA